MVGWVACWAASHAGGAPLIVLIRSCVAWITSVCCETLIVAPESTNKEATSMKPWYAAQLRAQLAARKAAVGLVALGGRGGGRGPSPCERLVDVVAEAGEVVFEDEALARALEPREELVGALGERQLLARRPHARPLALAVAGALRPRAVLV